MGGRIDCYVDIASLYSYLGFVHLVNNLKTLESHGVQVEFHPILLGAVMAKSGNSPPWTLRAKARYGAIEGPRATAQAGRPDIRFPEELMPMAHTVLPLRALHYIKSHHPREKYHAALEHLFHKFWTPPNLNLSQADVLAGVLADYKGFSSEECKLILEGARSQEMKDALTRSTQSALDKGAFGAPWLWVRNDKGVAEPFFGSDRFHHVYKFLGLPYQDLELLPPGGRAKL